MHPAATATRASQRQPRRVAVVGGGIAGMSAAYHVVKALGEDVVVTLLDSDAIGGHSLTLSPQPGPHVEHVPGLQDPVDVGFQVMNEETYPGLCQWYRDLGVELVDTDMAFSVSLPSRDHHVKYSSDVTPLVRWMLRHPWDAVGFVQSKARFHRDAWSFLGGCGGEQQATLGEARAKQQYHPAFMDLWLEPFVRAVWSSGGGDAADMDLGCLLPFLRNHGFLQWGSFQWKTPKGRAQAEVAAAVAWLTERGASVRPYTRVERVECVGVAGAAGATRGAPPAAASAAAASAGEWEEVECMPASAAATATADAAEGQETGATHAPRYRLHLRRSKAAAGAATHADAPSPSSSCSAATAAASTAAEEHDVLEADAVIFACSAPHLRAMAAPSVPLPAAVRDDATFVTRKWVVAVHRDGRVMPCDRSAWASWNVVEMPAQLDEQRRLVVTYWLQPLQGTRDAGVFVTLDPPAAVLRDALWQREMAHPQMVRGVAAAQAAVAEWNAGPAAAAQGGAFVAGAWVRYGFHEDGFASGAAAARACARLLAGEAAARRVPLWPVASSAQRGPLPVRMMRGVTRHAATAPPTHAFAYRTPELCAVDLECAPSYWWGGLEREDHWGDPRQPLVHAIVAEVHRSLPGAPYAGGPVDLITTLRAFGRCFNPLSLYLVWDDAARQRLLACVLEVTNTPWQERVVYALDMRAARRVPAAALRALMPAELAGAAPAAQERGADEEAAAWECAAVFRKTLHVSPFHPHPAERPQWYHARLLWTPAPRPAAPAADSSSSPPPPPPPPPPVLALHLSLDLHDAPPPADNAAADVAAAAADDGAAAADAASKRMHCAGVAPAEPLFRTSWSLQAGELRQPKPWPVAWLTLYRIMKQAWVMAGKGKQLHANLTNPVAPIDPWAVAVGALVTLLAAQVLAPLLHLLLPLLPAALYRAGAVGGLGLQLHARSVIPAARDMLWGWLLLLLIVWL